MNPRPNNLSLDANGDLVIAWSDGTLRRYGVSHLRDSCPCATCREKRSAEQPSLGQLPVISLEETRPLKIVAMKPVGNYAYSIAFSDGHDSGIFTLQQLWESGTVVSEGPP